jgi:hypothetical protein
MSSNKPDPMGAFETWLLRRVAQAVEAGEVSAKLLTDLQTACEAAREKPRAEGHAEAVQEIADCLAMPVEKVEAGLAAFEAQPTVTRELLMRRFVETWLEEQRRAYQHGGEAGGRA